MSRTFTLEEATAQLPRLREILMEMREKKPRVDELRQEIMGMTKKATGNGHLVSQDVRDMGVPAIMKLGFNFYSKSMGERPARASAFPSGKWREHAWSPRAGAGAPNASWAPPATPLANKRRAFRAAAGLARVPSRTGNAGHDDVRSTSGHRSQLRR